MEGKKSRCHPLRRCRGPMTYSYGAHSVGQRATLHPVLQESLDDVLALHDHKINIGARVPQAQQDAFDSGTSKVRGFNPDGSVYPYPHRVRDDGTCWAVDVIPIVNGVPLDPKKFGVDPWETSRWTRFIGMVEEAFFVRAREHYHRTNQKLKLRTGINWNRDAVILDAADRKFVDAYHVEMETA